MDIRTRNFFHWPPIDSQQGRSNESYLTMGYPAEAPGRRHGPLSEQPDSQPGKHRGIFRWIMTNPTPREFLAPATRKRDLSGLVLFSEIRTHKTK